MGVFIKLIIKSKESGKRQSEKKKIFFLKKKSFFNGLIIILGGLVFFCFWGKTIASGEENETVAQIFISEMMFNPSGKSEQGKEWIEIYFPHKTELENTKEKDGKFVFPLRVCYKIKTGKDKIKCEKSAEVFFEKEKITAEEGDYWIVAQNKKSFCQEYFSFQNEEEKCLKGEKGIILESKFTLYNSGQNFVGILKSTEEENQEQEEIFLDYLFYENSWAEEGFSLEKKKILNKSDQEIWVQSAVQGGTPFEKFKKISYPFQLFLNEIMPNPVGLDKNNEWIELVNLSKEKVNLLGWYFENGKGTQFKIKEKVEISPFGFWVIMISSGIFSIRNSDEKIAFFNPNGELVDEISWQKSAPSGISLNRKDEKQWEWSQFVTLGKENQFNHIPKMKVKIDSKIYRNVPVQFSAVGTKDNDGDKLKFVWDFGDGHRSYREKTTHIYNKKGKYFVKLIVKDGAAIVEKVFKIEVKSYPKNKLKIVEIEPNPKGKDKRNERIVIENRSSKKINLIDFLIATGKNSQKITNHPIYDDFFIAPRKSKEIKNEKICYFSLLNSKGLVKLLYPDKKKADVVKYEKNKIKEGEIYRLTESGWSWIDVSSFDSFSQKKQKSEKETSLKEDETLKADRLEIEVGLKSNILVLGTMDEESRACLNYQGLLIKNWIRKNLIWLHFFIIRNQEKY